MTRDPKSKNKMYLILDPGALTGFLCFMVVNQRGGKLLKVSIKKQCISIELLLAKVSKALAIKKLSFKDIAGIAVVQGGESFSTVRGVHAIANALGWSLQVPVCSLADCAKGAIQNAISHCRLKKRFHLLLPQYSREPNITIA
ncbi:MAG: hypothetical protein AB1352_02660 [Patescibacteria group bacterium]